MVSSCARPEPTISPALGGKTESNVPHVCSPRCHSQRRRSACLPNQRRMSVRHLLRTTSHALLFMHQKCPNRKDQGLPITSLFRDVPAICLFHWCPKQRPHVSELRSNSVCRTEVTDPSHSRPALTLCLGATVPSWGSAAHNASR